VYLQGGREPYICFVHDFLARNKFASCLHVHVWFWPTLGTCVKASQPLLAVATSTTTPHYCSTCNRFYVHSLFGNPIHTWMLPLSHTSTLAYIPCRHHQCATPYTTTKPRRHHRLELRTSNTTTQASPACKHALNQHHAGITAQATLACRHQPVCYPYYPYT
jgi:hypothetical protein